MTEKYFLLINKTDPQKYKKHALVIIWSFILLNLWAFFVNETDFRQQQEWACLVMFIGLVPTIIYFWRSDLSNIPLFALHGFFYSLCFGLPALFQYGFNQRPDQGIMVNALILNIFSLCSMYLGFYGLGNKLFNNIKSFKTNFNLSLEKLVLYGWFFEIFYLLYRVLLTEGGNNIALFDQVVPIFGWFGKCILFSNVLINRGEGKFSNRLFLFLTLPIEFLLAFVSGALAVTFVLFIFFGLIYLNYKKKLPIAYVIIPCLIFILLQPVKGKYREVVFNPNNKINITEKLGLFFSVLYEGYTDAQSSNSYNEQRIGRIDDIGILANVIANTPNNVPYRYGYTYTNLFTVWIPRIIWPEKPISAIGNEWAHWYGYLDRNDTKTTINLPWLVEFYVNFGMWGCLIGMFFVGLLFKYLSKKLSDPHHTILEYSISLPLVFSIWYAESNFALMFGGVVIGVIAFYFLLRFFKATS